MTNTIENNKLIAEFISIENPYHKGHYTCPNGIATKLEDMRYNSNWNWLMEVVQAIERKGFVVAIKGISCAIYPLLQDKPEYYIANFVCGDLSKKIDIVYTACIEFIKFYNTQK